MPDRTHMYRGRFALAAAAPVYVIARWLHKRRRRGAQMHRLESELRADGIVVLRPYLGVHGDALREIIGKLVDADRTAIIIDLRYADRMDASGLAALVGGLKEARMADGDLRVVGANGQPLEIMKLTGVDTTVHNYSSIEAAADGLGEPA